MFLRENAVSVNFQSLDQSWSGFLVVFYIILVEGVIDNGG